MNVGLSSKPSVDPAVNDFLQACNAQPVLERVFAIIRNCFPQLRDIQVRLVEDPDEENHAWILLQVMVPQADVIESGNVNADRFYDEMDRQLPLPYHPFSFSLEIARE